jgi:hypothetical protein
MKGVHIYALLFFVLIAACKSTSTDRAVKDNNTTSRVTGKYEASVNAPLCYVLCDFSASQDPASTEDMTTNAASIFDAIKEEYSVTCININTSQYERPFFQYSPPDSKDIETPKEKKKRKELVKQQQDSLTSRLNRLKMAIRASNTCLIRALERVASDLAVDPDNKAKPVRIIILSDMLEACANDFGRINLEKQPYKQAIAMLKKMKRPGFGFGGYSNIDISVTASSRISINDPGGLRNFWKEVFAKYGYTFNSPITASLPNWIHSINHP